MARVVNFKKFFLVFFMCLGLGMSGLFAHAEDSIDILAVLAEQGNAVAQTIIGENYANGEGVSQDDEKAVYYFELAAKQDYFKAQYSLGVMYANGQGVVQDDKKAFYYWKLAAKQGHADAHNNLGVQYALGQGVPQDDVKAYAHVLIAAALDSSHSKFKEFLEPKLTSSQREKPQALASKMWEELPK